jgi:tyrosine-protein phosphatase SIW14
MNTKLIQTAGLSFIIALTAAFIPAQTRSNATPKYDELPNFHQVNEKLYRGAQPKKEGFKRLAQLGVKTIVNLRDDDAMAQREGSEARAAGLQYFNLPLSRTGRPTDEQVERALALLNSTKNQPVFVHCRLGADRTGTIIAVYRISHDGWTSERAKAEANRYGMHFWETGMKDYIHDYYQRLQTSKKVN